MLGGLRPSSVHLLRQRLELGKTCVAVFVYRCTYRAYVRVLQFFSEPSNSLQPIFLANKVAPIMAEAMKVAQPYPSGDGLTRFLCELILLVGDPAEFHSSCLVGTLFDIGYIH